jgi:hypothetical protein
LNSRRLAVLNLFEQRHKQLKKEEKESGTKQLDTELTDQLDYWQRHRDDLERLDANEREGKEAKEEFRLRQCDR